MEKEKGIVGVKWIKRQERGRKCEGGNEALGEWEGREVKEQRTRDKRGENPTIGREFRGMSDQEVRDGGHWPQEVCISCHGRGKTKIAGWGEEFRGSEVRARTGRGESKGKLGVR